MGVDTKASNTDFELQLTMKAEGRGATKGGGGHCPPNLLTLPVSYSILGKWILSYFHYEKIPEAPLAGSCFFWGGGAKLIIK